MRLSDVLSKPLTSEFKQIDGFLSNAKLNCGKQKKIDVGVVALPYFCISCEDDLTFNSNGELFCIGINDRLISIDSVLKCPRCGAFVPVWFLVESKGEAHALAPEVRVLKRTEKLTENVQLSRGQYGDFSELLEKADRAYRDELGAGAIVYLRKILELVTEQTAEAEEIETKKANGSPKPFKEVLESVDKRRRIIPREFSDNGYKLFGELSDVVHSDYDEHLGLKKYDTLRRLVIGVLDNIKINRELLEAIGTLGWNADEVPQHE